MSHPLDEIPTHSPSTQTSRRPNADRRHQFVLVLGTNFAFFLSFSLFFLLPIFVTELGGSEDDIGFLMGVGGVASLASIPLVGVLIDRWGRKSFVVVGCLLMVIADAGFLLLDQMGAMVYVVRILQMVAFAMSFTAAGTLAADLAEPDRRSWALGLFGAGTLLTHAIGPQIAEPIIKHWGFDWLFILAAAVAAVAALIATRLAEPAPLVIDAGEFETPPRQLSLLELVVETGIFFPLLLNIVMGAAFGSILFLLPTYVRTVGLPAVAPFFTAYSIMAVLVRVFAGGLPDRYGRQWFVIPCGFIYCACIYALVYLNSTSFLVVLGLVYGLSHGFLYPVLNALVVDRAAGTGSLGRAMSLFIVGFNAGVTFSGFLYGPVAEHHGYPAMYRLSSLIALAGVLLYVAAEARRWFWLRNDENTLGHN